MSKIDWNKINTLSFSGGGVRGIAFAGVAQALEEMQVLKNFKNFTGSSIGALAATIFASGFSSTEIYNLLYNINLPSLKDVSIKSIITEYGLCKGDELENIVGKILEQKFNEKGITFSQLYEKTGNSLCLTGTCLNSESTKYFNKDTTPEIQIKTAVRISCSIPFFYKPVKIGDEYFVDGGVLDNLPIEIFDRKHTVGLRLVSTKENRSVPIKNFENYVTQTANTLLDATDRLRTLYYQSKGEPIPIVEINTGNISSYNFNLTENEKTHLVEAGYEAIIQNKLETYCRIC